MAILVVAPLVTFAQTDEIQVYDGSIAPPGVFNLTLAQQLHPRRPEDTGIPRRPHPRQVLSTA